MFAAAKPRHHYQIRLTDLRSVVASSNERMRLLWAVSRFVRRVSGWGWIGSGTASAECSKNLASRELACYRKNLVQEQRTSSNATILRSSSSTSVPSHWFDVSFRDTDQETIHVVLRYFCCRNPTINKIMHLWITGLLCLQRAKQVIARFTLLIADQLLRDTRDFASVRSAIPLHLMWQVHGITFINVLKLELFSNWKKKLQTVCEINTNLYFKVQISRSWIILSKHNHCVLLSLHMPTFQSRCLLMCRV